MRPPSGAHAGSRRRRSLGFSLLFAASAALGGAALPFTFGEMFPRSFTATAVVGVEKGEAAARLAASLKADETLERVASALDLSREPLLSGTVPGPLAVAGDLLTGRDTTAALPAVALRRTLSESLSLMPDRRAGQVSLAVTTPSPALSVRIANAFAGDSVSRATEQAVDEAHGLTLARTAAEKAERALADFTAAHAAADPDAAARTQADIAAADAEIASREETLALLRKESGRVSSLDLADAVDRSADLGLDMPSFDEARQKYVAAKLDYDRLTADLGPRHPRLLAARSAADDARNRLQEALRKLDAAYKDRVKTATRALEEAKAARSRLAPVSEGAENELSQQAALQHEADRLRAEYLDRLDISRAAPPPPATVQVLMPARLETVIANGAAPLLVAVAGAGLGLIAAFVWLYASGALRRSGEADSADEPVAADYGFDGANDDDDWGPPPAENDDLPLAERLRAVLRRSAEMDEREAHYPSVGDPREAELEEIRRRMAALRQRVEAYQSNRASPRR